MITMINTSLEIASTIICIYGIFSILMTFLNSLNNKFTKFTKFTKYFIPYIKEDLYIFTDDLRYEKFNKNNTFFIKEFFYKLFIVFIISFGVSYAVLNGSKFNESNISMIEKEYQYQIDSLKTVLSNKNLNELIGQYHLIKNTDNKHLTKKDVYEFAVKCEAWYPDIIANQAVIESAKFSSNVFKRTNNLFGMKLAKSRKTTRNIASNEKEYADFYNWQLSVIDRILWDYAMFDSIPTRAEYLKKLQKIYAEDENYISKIR